MIENNWFFCCTHVGERGGLNLQLNKTKPVARRERKGGAETLSFVWYWIWNIEQNLDKNLNKNQNNNLDKNLELRTSILLMLLMKTKAFQFSTLRSFVSDLSWMEVLDIKILRVCFISRWRFSVLRLLLKTKAFWFINILCIRFVSGWMFSMLRSFASASCPDRGSRC